MIDRMLRVLRFRQPIQTTNIAARNVCVGRDQLCEDVLRSVFSHGCVLLFGGRQAGKTSFLHHVARQLDLDLKHGSGTHLQVPVFVDLMRLPYDATPGDFFATLVRLSIQACEHHFPGRFRGKRFGSKVTGLESFEQALLRIRSTTHSDVRFVYLLDESKRVIGNRFPRGFHDNLFHVLFGGSAIQGVCSVVFAGAQELYILCEDDTSPIGSRAAKHCLTNLTPEAILQMAHGLVVDLEPERIASLAEEVHKWTGGHAGLSDGLLRSFALLKMLGREAVDDAVDRFRRERSELFQLWLGGLTKEGRAIHDLVIDRTSISMAEVAEHLRRMGLGAFRSDRAADELQYVGLALRKGDYLVSCNPLYAGVARLYVTPVVATELERQVWPLVEQTELGLRQLVRSSFNAKWGLQADDQIQLGIGDRDSWLRILENREKYKKSYPRSKQTIDADEVLNFTYLGQLAQLIVWKKAWDLFKHLFRDKRELEDMIRDIVPVRNDGAHFRSVPEHELERCRLRCIDLQTILERNRQALY